VKKNSSGYAFTGCMQQISSANVGQSINSAQKNIWQRTPRDGERGRGGVYTFRISGNRYSFIMLRVAEVDNMEPLPAA